MSPAAERPSPRETGHRGSPRGDSRRCAEPRARRRGEYSRRSPRARASPNLLPRSCVRSRVYRGAHPSRPRPSRPRRPPQPKWIWVGVGAVLTIGGSASSAYTESPRFPFHVENEGWFGQNTYVGGADKASHFVSFYGVPRIANEYNRAFHVPKDQAALLASGTAFLGGLMTEIGDGTNKFGFSWEDLTMDALGAATGLAIMHYNLDDLFGFRAGIVPGSPTAPTGGLGRDYSSEIYTADFKFAGIAKRACFNPGFARYFLFSITYGTKGYPYSDPIVRQRQLGLEIGLNFGAIMEALHVPKNKWWGVCLYTLFDIIRFPYTAVGWRSTSTARSGTAPTPATPSPIRASEP